LRDSGRRLADLRHGHNDTDSNETMHSV
jgi:hypothetical protein